MKMIRRTRTTSTSGMMLISASEPVPRKRLRRPPLNEFAPPNENAIESALETLLGEVHELELEVFHSRAEFLDRVSEPVVEDHRGDGGCEPKRSGDERFRDSGRDGPEAGRAGGAELLEGVNDAPYRSEQADEGRDCGSSGEQSHVAFEPRDFFRHRELERALERERVGDAAARFHLALDFVVTEIEEGDQGRAAELFADDSDSVESRGFTERAQKSSIGGTGARKDGPFRKGDCPREQREKEQDHHDGFG